MIFIVPMIVIVMMYNYLRLLVSYKQYGLAFSKNKLDIYDEKGMIVA